MDVGERGYVTFQSLKGSDVHSQALLSRRINELEHRGLVEITNTNQIAKSKKNRTIDAKSKSVRITREGMAEIEPVYKNYETFCDDLLESLSAEDRKPLLIALGRIRKRLSWGNPR